MKLRELSGWGSVLAGAVAGVMLAPAGAAEPAMKAASGPADLLLVHGKIHTEDAERRVVDAMAVRGNAIVAVGTDEAVSVLAGPNTRRIDLHGAVVRPGIIDAHTHPAEGSQDLGKCSLEDKEMTAAEVKRRVAKCLAESPGDPSQWFEAVMVDPSGLTLSLADLDSMLSSRPLLLSGSDGHTAWANSAALKLSHIDASTPEPAGGHIERDAAGNPTGTLRDNANLPAYAARPKASLDARADLLDKALASMRATGITSVQDAAADDDMMRMYKRLYDTHRLDMRVRASYHIKNLHDSPRDILQRASKFRATWSIDPDFLRADAVKIFADGVIEYPSQTAALLEPYLDAHGHPTRNVGPHYFEQDNLNKIVTAADAAGFTVHIHAIGDRAVRSSLDAIAAARKANGPRDNRDQIAHLELIDPADFPRFKQLNVIANFQLQWAMRDPYVEKATIEYLGPERSRHLYPAGSLHAAGALIVGGSDWNVSTFDAFEAMEHAITRAQGKGMPALLPEESLTIQEMVDAYTINAAHALEQERTTGSLEAGKRADFVILDRDIFAIDPYRLHETRVKATYLDGREVYRAGR
ncbi:MAG TPA: amidohydrolase family protein [Steroidobacteraceae bacterium]|nr:amidohydrolase family protein [Steroidobacteraceae bacterium]